MSEKKLTGWLKGSERPVRIGVYQRKFSNDETHYSKWTGESWMFSHQDINLASTDDWHSTYQNIPWRGLARRPR